MPLPEEARKALVAAAPRGRVSDVSFAWTGEIERPATYIARGKFADLGDEALRRACQGSSGFAGAFDVNDKGGTVTLQSSGDDRRVGEAVPRGADRVRLARGAGELDVPAGRCSR